MNQAHRFIRPGIDDRNARVLVLGKLQDRQQDDDKKGDMNKERNKALYRTESAGSTKGFDPAKESCQAAKDPADDNQRNLVSQT